MLIYTLKALSDYRLKVERSSNSTAGKNLNLILFGLELYIGCGTVDGRRFSFSFKLIKSCDRIH